MSRRNRVVISHHAHLLELLRVLSGELLGQLRLEILLLGGVLLAEGVHGGVVCLRLLLERLQHIGESL